VKQTLVELLRRAVLPDRDPDFVIGDEPTPYLLRWWLLPRNRVFNVYFHEFLRSDDDRALHDHPWINVSLVLSGGYDEVTPNGTFRRRVGDVVFRLPRSRHRIALINEMPCETLFLTGPRVREWGFWCPQGWVPWQQFVEPTADGNRAGRGCDQ